MDYDLLRAHYTDSNLAQFIALDEESSSDVQTTTDLAFPVRQRDKVSRARSVVGLDGIDHPKMELVQRAGFLRIQGRA